jgi:methane/ammonia monooxygenase subunit C
MGVVLAFMGTRRCSAVYARLIEFGTGIPAKNPYLAEMYKLALEGYLYSRFIP